MKTSRLPLYAGLSMGLIGTLLIFGPLLHLLSREQVHTHINYEQAGFYVAGPLVLPIVGIALVYLAIFVYHRRLFATYISAGMSVLTVVYLFILYPFKPITVLVTLLTLIYLIFLALGQRQLIVKSNFEDLSSHLQPIAVIVLTGFIYGLLGFYILGKPLFHTQFSLTTSFDMTLDGLTGFSGTIDEPTRAGKLFIDSLGGIGIVVFILILEALFRPLRFKILTHQEDDAHRLAETLVRIHSVSSEDFFKLWPSDKQYFFSHDQQSFLAYKPSGRTLVVLSDPVGDPHSFEGLVAEFMSYCRSHGWFVAVINASDVSKQLYKHDKHSSLFIGNEGIVQVVQFVNETNHTKHFRYIRNKAERDDLKVEEWRDLTDDQITKLQTISSEWLSRGSRREYTFFMGYFDPTYLRRSRIFVLTQQGRAVAYVNLIPSFHKGHLSIDHLRSRKNISSAGMHFLLMSILQQLHDEQAKTLNIGLSPLSGVESSNTKLIPKATLRLFRRFGASYYSFQGLEQFKNKFKPKWEPRALIYTGTPVNLIRITTDIEHATAYAAKGNGRLYWSTLGGILLLAIGIYFILG